MTGARAARLLFLAGAVAVGLLLVRASPRDLTLVYGVAGSGAERLEVEIARGDEVLRRAEFRLDGAAGQVSHRVRLPDGEYAVRAILSGPTRTRRVERSLTVSESGTVVLPLGE